MATIFMMLSASLFGVEKSYQEQIDENFTDYQDFFKTNFPSQKITKRKFLKYLKYAENFHEIANEYDYRKRKGKLTRKYKIFFKKQKKFMMKYFKPFLLTEIDRNDINYDENKIIKEFREKRNYDIIKEISSSVGDAVKSISGSSEPINDGEREQESIKQVEESGESVEEKAKEE